MTEHSIFTFCVVTSDVISAKLSDNHRLSCECRAEFFVILNASGFEKPVQRRKVQNFASAAVKCKVKTKDLKVVELQGTRNLFGRLLYLSTLEHIDLEKVFWFPLTPMPLSLSHLDGSINKLTNLSCYTS